MLAIAREKSLLRVSFNTNPVKTHKLRFAALFLPALFLFASCKKGEAEKPPEPTTPALSSNDPQAVSAAVKVWHGERLQGNAPAPKGTALQLDASRSAPLTLAFAGRYAIVQPRIAQGDALGYYLQLSGAKEYFKIDYNKPRNARLQPLKTAQPPFSINGRQARVQGGNEDSAIVIALPANLHVPDTICFRYCAYDAAGNVSNVVTTCVVVNNVGADAAGSWVNGTWRFTASWDTSRQHVDTVLFNKWAPDRTSTGYICRYDAYTNSYSLFRRWLWSDTTTAIVNDSLMRLKYDFTFGNNGGIKYEYADLIKEVDTEHSTCSQFAFRPPSGFTESLTGAWNYNSATGKMMFVAEFDENGTPSLKASGYSVIKITDTHMILVYEESGFTYHYRLEK